MGRVTHFANDTLDLSKSPRPRVTLCGRDWDTVIANDRPATCGLCTGQHAARTGWAFPLPPVVE